MYREGPLFIIGHICLKTNLITNQLNSKISKLGHKYPN